MEFKGSSTKRRRVVEAIAGSIRSGKLEPGDRLSTVRDLAAHFNSSLSVVQSAMRELIGNGMVECRGREGFYVRQTVAAEHPTVAALVVPEKDPGPVMFCCHHHSDLIWRRTYQEYRAIRAKQIDRLLSFFQKHPGFHCFFDQSEVVANYLEDRPDRVEEFRRWVGLGGIELIGGMSIPDLNLCGGESLIRNLRFGREFYYREFGLEPSIASMTDA
ncbi:MAG: GntR family transcriptional regulator, partial [Kiritimatiellia bacterium]|nr:GntR family transcriptional regulator [Kiritimatiellia bacterium]